tara:strand:- start:28772 stop:29815 length:1044 start_codon:yes stop_codon:yes gene_type:complete
MYIKKILWIIALAGLVLLGIFSYSVYNSIFSPNTKFEDKSKIMYVPSGATYQMVLDSLRPLVKDISSFDAVAQKKGYSSKVKAGKYILKRNMSNNDLVNVLRSQNTPVSVVFNNQERLEELAGRISSQIEADSVSLLQVMKEESFLKANNLNKVEALTMYIPNKYEFFWNTSAEGFRERMLSEYKKFWNTDRLNKAKEIGLTTNEVSVIASIVQKETAKVDERAKVAGVYMNRYKDGWKLEADPTVIYAIKERTGDFETVIKRVLYKDLKLESPYNTYMNVSLPPGPITMPDISSIDAVLNYEDHKYYYFVADVENFGYHKFAETLSQHNRNKQAYVRWINSQGINR